MEPTTENPAMSLDDIDRHKENILPCEETPPEKQKANKRFSVLSHFFGYDCPCGCLVLMIGFAGPIPLVPYFFPFLFTNSAEHLPTAEYFSPEATNFSYHDTFMHRVREFDIPEEAFLKMCEKSEGKPISIATLPDLPRPDHPPQVNARQGDNIPLTIVRYVYPRKEHRQCNPWNFAECKIDQTGKTDDSCFHSVSKGYYYENRLGNGGGIYMLYDSENGRCYMHWNHH